MGIQVVQTSPGGQNPSSTTVSDTFTNTVRSNNLIVVIACKKGTQAVGTVSDSAGNTYTRAINRIGNGKTVEIWYTFPCTGGASFTVTASWAGTGAISIVAAEVGGGPPVQGMGGQIFAGGLFALYQVNSQTGPNGNSSSGPISTTDSQIDFAVSNDGVGPGAPSGWTDILQEPLVVGTDSDYKIIQAATTDSATWNGSSAWAAAIAGFQLILPAIVHEIAIGEGPPMRIAPWMQRLPPELWPTIKAPPYPTYLYPPEVTFGPPIPGAPWTLRRLPEEQLLSQAPPPPPVTPILMPVQPEVRHGPPMQGAPWFALAPRSFDESSSGLFIAPKPQPQIYAPETVIGPPIAGAPWTGRRFVMEPFGQAPPPPGVQLYIKEITIGQGPPMRGAPWMQLRMPGDESTITRPPVPIPVVVTSQLLPLLSRITRDDLQPGKERRLVRFSEIVSNIINALISSGALVQTGPQTFQLVNVAYTPGTPSNWAGASPASVAKAIDRIAAWIKSQGGTL